MAGTLDMSGGRSAQAGGGRSGPGAGSSEVFAGSVGSEGEGSARDGRLSMKSLAQSFVVEFVESESE